MALLSWQLGNHPFKTPHLAVLIENATWCESATMWHIFGASRRPSERGLTPARWQMIYW